MTDPRAAQGLCAQPAPSPAAEAASIMVFNCPGEPQEPREIPLPRLGPGEALIAVELATVCGSDVHTSLGHRSEPTPLVLGHEAVGRVAATGSPAPSTADGVPVETGDRVVWSLAVHCGECDRCAKGLTQKCRSLRKFGHERLSDEWPLSGGFASHVLLPAGTALVRAPEDLPAEVLAPAGCGIATAWAGLRAAERVRDLPGAAVLITGGGLIGLAAAAMASERGAAVTLSDPDPDRRALALRFGAGLAVAPEGVAPDAEFDVVLDASGAPAAVAAGLAALAIGGVAVWVGSVFPSDPIPILPERIVRGLTTITGVHNYAPADLEDAVAFLARSGARLPFAELVGARLPLAQLDSALSRAAEQHEVRVAILPPAAAPSGA